MKINFGDFKGMEVADAVKKDHEGAGRLLKWLESKFDPHHKFAAQNKAMMNELRTHLNANEPGVTVSRSQSAAYNAARSTLSQGPQQGTETLLRQLNVQVAVLITLLGETNKKLGGKKPDYPDEEVMY